MATNPSKQAQWLCIRHGTLQIPSHQGRNPEGTVSVRVTPKAKRHHLFLQRTRDQLPVDGNSYLGIAFPIGQGNFARTS